jgi:hypothetical protein
VLDAEQPGRFVLFLAAFALVGGVDRQDNVAARHEQLADLDDVVGLLVAAGAVLQEDRGMRLSVGLALREVEVGGDAVPLDAVELDAILQVVVGLVDDLLLRIESLAVRRGIRDGNGLRRLRIARLLCGCRPRRADRRQRRHDEHQIARRHAILPRDTKIVNLALYCIRSASPRLETRFP